MKTSKYIISLVLAVWCALGNLYAVDQSYYTSVNGKSGKDLFDAVHTVSKTGYKGVSYDGLWTVYCSIDLNSSGKVWDMYSCVTSYTCGGSAQGANYSKEGDSYNREHSIPKSWFGGSTSTSTPGTDLFHVVPTDGYVNNQRSAYAFGEVSSASYTSQSGCKKGSPKSITISNSILNKSVSSTQSCSASTVFEPMDEFKGDFARGYFGTMIKWANGDYQTFTTAEGAQIFNTAYTADKYYGLTGYGVALLLKWHREDPVSQKEIDRNNGIQNQQGNRNPFIDYPELVEYIWGEQSGETVTLSSLTPTFDGGFTPVTPTTYTVVLSRNGQLESITGVSGTYNLPASSDAACDGWTFAGWSATKVTSTTSQPSFITSVNAGGTVYAVYSKTSTPAPHRAKMADTEVTFTPGTDTGGTSVTKNNVTCTMTTMSNSSYYQIYANQSGTFSCSAGNITKIEFTCTASGTSKYGPGNASADVGTYSYSGSKGTWTGSASSVTISSTAQVRMSSLTVTYSGSSGSSTTYDSEPEDCQCSGQFAAPTVNATASDKTITLTWADISGATNGYIVFIGTGVGYTTECADPEIGSITNSNGSNTCEITGLVNGLEYTASVVANATATTCEGIAGTATATPIGCQAWADPTFTYATTTLNVGGGKVSSTITGTTYGTPTFTSSNTSVLTVDEDGKISPVSAGTATVTAQWPGDGTHCPKDVVSNTITVKGTVVLTFNANDGSDNPATTTQNFTYGEAQNLTANSFSRTGYTFQGWATEQSGAKVYNDGASVTLTEDITLYAVWQINSHNVTFTQPTSGGTFTVNSSSSSPVSNVNYGSTVTIVVTPTNSHFTVNSVTVSGASGSVAVSGEGNTRTFTMPDEDVTVAVTMTEDTKYTVNWYVNGTSQKAEENYAGEALAGVADPDIDCYGKVFQGWTETANYSSEDNAPNDLFKELTGKTMPVGGANYYAVFAMVEEMEPVITDNYQKITSTSELTTGKYLIVGYNNGYNAMSTTWKDQYYLDSKTVTPSNDVITTTDGAIIWNITVSNDQVSIHNETEGYLYIAQSGSYYNIKLGNNTTDNKFTYSVNEGNWLFTSVTYTSRVLEYYTKNTRWAYYTAADAPVYLYKQQCSEGSTTISNYATTCSAPADVTVTFDANGGEGTMADQVMGYNTTTALTANSFTRTGYSFAGWATSATGSKAYDDEESVTLTKNMTLYALWSKNNYNVIFTPSITGATITVNDASTSPQSVEFESTVSIAIEPDEAYMVSSVTATGGVTPSGSGNNWSFTMPASDVTVTVTLVDRPTYTIRFIDNGSIIKTQTVYYGAAASKPEDPTHCEGNTFVGWANAPLAEDSDTKPALVTNFTATQDQDYYAVYSYSKASSSAPNRAKMADVTDVLTLETTGVTGNAYTEWSDISVTSSAVYAGQSAAGNSSIQLRSRNSNSGIISTTSGGKLKSVTVVWNENTANAGTLNVYGKNSAYEAPTDLFSNSSQGTSLGTIVNGTSTELSITGDYEYIGLRSANGALYLTSVSITWSAGGSSTTTYYTTAPDCEAPIVTSAKMLVAEYGGARVALAHDNTNTVAAMPLMYFGGNYFCPNLDKNGNTASAPEKATLTWQVAERTDGYYIKSGDKFLAATANGFTLTDTKFLWSKDGGTRLAYDATTEKFVADQQGELPGITPVNIPSSISLTELKSQRSGLTIGYFGTICLPHAVALPFTWGVKVYSIKAKKMTDGLLSGIYIVEETEMLNAGQPYLIEAKETQMTMWYPKGAETVTETVSALGLVGNLGTTSVYVPVGCYGISNNKLRRVAAENTATIGQYKAYIDLTDVPVEGVGISMHSKYKVLYTAEGENVATDTEQLFDATGINWNEPVYNILGIRVDRNCTGVLIQNGKKFLVTHPRP